MIMLQCVDTSSDQSLLEYQRDELTKRDWPEIRPSSIEIEGDGKIKAIVNYSDDDQLDRFCKLVVKRGGFQLAILAHAERDKAILPRDFESSPDTTHKQDGMSNVKWVKSRISAAVRAAIDERIPRFDRPDDFQLPSERSLPRDVISRRIGDRTEVLLKEPSIPIDAKLDFQKVVMAYKYSGGHTYSTMQSFEISKRQLEQFPLTKSKDPSWLAAILDDEVVDISPIYENRRTYRRQLPYSGRKEAYEEIFNQMQWRRLPLQMNVSEIKKEDAQSQRRASIWLASEVIFGISVVFFAVLVTTAGKRGIAIFAMHAIHAALVIVVICRIMIIDNMERTGVTPLWNAAAVSLAAAEIWSFAILFFERVFMKDVHSQQGAYVYGGLTAAVCVLIVILLLVALASIESIPRTYQSLVSVSFLSTLLALWPLAFGGWTILSIMAQAKKQMPIPSAAN